MSFTVRLSSDLVAVEAGGTAPVSVTVDNRGTSREQFEFDIEGIDVEWRAVPVNVFSVEPGESHAEKFFFKPPRASESAAGNYPFVLRVRSLETGETKTVQGVLEIRPFHHLSMEITPKKGFVSPTKHQNQFDVTLVNLGNTEHTVKLMGSDPEDALTFDFEPDQVTVGPGQQRDITAVANPTSNSLVSSGRLIGFTITGRSSQVPSVAAASQAQLEQRSLFSPASLIGILIVGLIFALFLMNMPKPPQVVSFTAQPDEVLVGETVSLSWVAPEASTIRLSVGGERLEEFTQGTTSYTYRVPETLTVDTLTFELVAERNDMRSEAQRRTVRVRRPEVVPDPKIVSLAVSPRKIRLGQPFILNYRFENVTRAVLSPANMELDPNVPSVSYEPEVAGTAQFTVVAYNKAGKTVSKSFSVEVVDESDATIIAFLAVPQRVRPDEGRTRLSWQVANAVRVELTANGDPVDIGQGAVVGNNVEVPITAKTVFLLTAYDQKGRKVTRSITVDILPPDPPVQPDPAPTDPPPVDPGVSSTGGTTGTTTGTGNR